MRATRWMALAVALMVLAGTALAGNDGGRRRGKGAPESLFDQLVRECKLTEQQQADIKAKTKARDDALAAWDKANGEKLQAAQEAAKTARSGGDADAKKKAAADLKELQTAREASAADATAAVLAALTAEQKAAWNGYQLFTTLQGRYRKAALTEEQLAKVKAACAVAAKELGDITDDDSKAKRAKRAVTDRLRWGIDVFVLTPEQREAVGPRPAGKGKGKGAPDAPAPAPADTEKKPAADK